MIDERQEELAALEALDLLEGAEKAQFEGEMVRNAELRQRVQELRSAAAALAHTARPASPPAALKDRILASAAARKQEEKPEPVQPSKIVPFPTVIAWAAAACFALAAAWSAQLYFATRTRNQVLEDEQRAANVEVEQLKATLEAERILAARQLADSKDLAELKISTLVSLLGNSPQAQAVAVWDPAKQQGVLQVAKLPAAGEDQDYELWVIPPGKNATPVAAGLVPVDAKTGAARVVFRSERPIATVATLAVTLEPKGGGPVPRGKAVLVSR